MKKLYAFLIFSCLLMTNIVISYSQEMKMEEPKEEKAQPKKEEKKEEKLEEMKDVKEEIPERLKFFKEKYEYKVHNDTIDYYKVRDAVVAAIIELKCQVANNNSKADEKNNNLQKGKIESDFCVFANGREETFDALQKYSYKMPIIRGGIWSNGRIQYKVYLKETDDGASVEILVKGEISGMEAFVTNEIHFWQSNGMFETKLLDTIKAKLGVK